MKKLFFALLLFFSAACLAQSTVPLVGLPVDHGPALPTTCNIGQIYFQIAGGGGGIGLYACTAPNTWTGPFGTGGGSPGGSNTQVQFNNNGAFGGITGATSDGTNLAVTTQSANDNSTKAASTAYVDRAANTLPSLGSLTQINFTGASATATQNTTNGPIMIYEPNHAGENWALLTQAQPTIPYGFVANIRCGEYQQANINTATCGVYFEDNISGKIMGFELENVSGSTLPRVEHITNPTTDGSTAFSVPPGTAQLFGSWNAYAASTWIRLRNNGTTLYFDVSVDGSNFVNMYSEAVGSFITPTSIGYGGILVNGSTNWQQISILSWTLINNANP